MKTSLKYSQKAKSMLEIIRKDTRNKTKNTSVLPYKPKLHHPLHTEDSSNPCASSLLKKHTVELEEVQRNAVEMIKGM